MVHLTIKQQEQEIQDIEYLLKSTNDLEIIEIQCQQIKRLVYFAKRGITAHKENRRPSFNRTTRSENSNQNYQQIDDREEISYDDK